jgi:hypothetical protein
MSALTQHKQDTQKNMTTEQMAKTTVDITAYGTAVATLLGWLPHIAALFSLIYFAIQITEKVAGKPFHELLRRAWQKPRG